MRLTEKVPTRDILLKKVSLLLLWGCAIARASVFDPAHCQRLQAEAFWVEVKGLTVDESRILAARLAEHQLVIDQSMEAFTDLNKILRSLVPVSDGALRTSAGSALPANATDEVARATSTVMDEQSRTSEYQAAFLQELIRMSTPPNRPVDSSRERRLLWGIIHGGFDPAVRRRLDPRLIFNPGRSVTLYERMLRLAANEKLPRNVRWMLLWNVNFYPRHGLELTEQDERFVRAVEKLLEVST